MLVIANRFGNSSEKVINELFRDIAYKIGDRNVISEIISEAGLEEASRKFGIGYNDRRPILLIMDKHPNNLISGDKVIKIQLGDYGADTDRLRDDLHKLSLLVKHEDFKKILWERRKELILKILSKIPYVDIITTATSFGRPPV